MPYLEHDSAYSILFTQPVFFDELRPENKQMEKCLVPEHLNYHGRLELNFDFWKGQVCGVLIPRRQLHCDCCGEKTDYVPHEMKNKWLLNSKQR